MWIRHPDESPTKLAFVGIDLAALVVREYTYNVIWRLPFSILQLVYMDYFEGPVYPPTSYGIAFLQ